MPHAFSLITHHSSLMPHHSFLYSCRSNGSTIPIPHCPFFSPRGIQYHCESWPPRDMRARRPASLGVKGLGIGGESSPLICWWCVTGWSFAIGSHAQRESVSASG